MSKSITPSDIAVGHRRRLVARLLARRGLERLGLRGISAALADTNLPEDERSVSPNGEPWSVPTLSRDVAHVRQMWREEAAGSVTEFRAKQLAVLDELLGTALCHPTELGWASEARKVITAQIALLGTDTDQTRVFAHVELQMNLALNRLEAEFAREPVLLKRVISALIGGEHEAQPLALPHGPAADA